jgi:formate-dependent nitrite reductase membrane component NrfD
MNHNPQQKYYDVTMLKRSPWKWEISSYFFLGGLSGGAYLLARLAARLGGKRLQPIRQLGAAVAAISILPCGPLLIKDLGDMRRFHHMLRVFKPQTPMSLGTWTVALYSSAAAVALLRELMLQDECNAVAKSRLQRWTERADPGLLVIIDGAGVPAAMLMTSYTGLLLSCTATPLWTRNAWLSPLFVSSALTTGAAAIELGLACCKQGEQTAASEQVLNPISRTARMAEAITLTGYLRSLGERAGPLVKGKHAHHTWLAYAALVAPELIEAILPTSASPRWKLALRASILLYAGLSLRKTIVNAGNESADDPDLARSVGNAASTSPHSEWPIIEGADATPRSLGGRFGSFGSEPRSGQASHRAGH